ncbi:MAG TPA: Ig-like domain-containing protein [Lachnospiraceae bacterium]|nr:Ig-like domain-containing protein [Lachnospiraceae bacterium]
MKVRKLIIAVLVTILLPLTGTQAVRAEKVTTKDGKTIYTVYTREEFLTEVYNNIMNENCSVIIRMTDDALAKEMSYEMGLREKMSDYYTDLTTDYWYEGDEHPEFDEIYTKYGKEYLNEDENLLNTYGVYNKYGILKDRLYSPSDIDYTLEKKSDGWYWKFSYIEEIEVTRAQYEEMMSKVASAMKTLNLETKNDYQRLKAICDWITSNTDYDYSLNKYTDYDNLVKGTSVCQGYAEATDLVLRSVGYKSQFACANNMNHAWNIVLLNNKWYMIDNTWDDCLSSYDYFLYGTSTAADTISMGGIISEDEGLYIYDLTQYVTDKTPLATSYYSGDGTTYNLNSWLIDITDKNVRATVGDTVDINSDRLTQVISSDSSIASIEGGKIVCHKPGRVNITRTDGTYVSHYFVLVSDKTTLTLKDTDLTLAKGKSTTMKPKVTNAVGSEVSYTSSNKSVATVSKNGKIVARKKGKATITVTLGDIKQKVNVIVK